VNLLILDEPTNHLDMPSKDVLKEAIKAFDGTAIIVSHDREFLDGLVSKVYEFGGGKVREYLGGIYDWINTHPQSLPKGGKPEMDPPQGNTIGKQLSKSNKDSLPSGGQGMGSYLERKELLKRKSRLEKSIKEVEKKIETLEARIAELDAILCTPEGASDMTVVTEYTSTKRLIDQETDRWAQLSEELETIEL
jgi:ATP-binding cassette subfamily F protein 3